MATLIPETLTRLGAIAFVQNAELEAVNRDRIIRMAAEQMAEQALRKILQDCVKSEGDYQGFRGQMLRLDVYVLSPQELYSIVAEAVKQGEQDAMRWFSVLHKKGEL